MWDVDFIQFARLLDELNAIGLSQEQLTALAKNMEVEPKDVKQLLNRAAVRWEEIKPLLVKKTPLSEDQVAEELAESGKVVTVVAVDFGEVVGHLEDESLETVIDEISERAANVPLSNVDYKVLFADNDTLYLKVTAQADDLVDDEEEDEVVVE